MQLIPTEQEVIELLKQTGALRFLAEQRINEVSHSREFNDISVNARKQELIALAEQQLAFH